MSYPYDPNDMNAAVKYAQKIKAEFKAGNIKKAYKLFLDDPNGNTVDMETFIKGYQKIIDREA